MNLTICNDFVKNFPSQNLEFSVFFGAVLKHFIHQKCLSSNFSKCYS